MEAFQFGQSWVDYLAVILLVMSLVLMFGQIRGIGVYLLNKILRRKK